ncbi:MAG: hypothetical protein JXR77_07755 [Lentisphaeria bacterium]|nr:hypothetical protein [Lentisphaeria bacterium]
MIARDKARLRDLACRYAEVAEGPVMAQRREKWRLHNRLQERTFPFHIEDNGSYHRDLTPPLQCEEGECRGLEGRLLRALVAYETIDDDRIIPNRFVVDWCTPMTGYCDELRITRAEDGHGGVLGYETNKPIRDIDADFGKLKKRTISLDRERTERQCSLAQETFAGLLPVEVGRPSSLYSNGITNKAVHLMGMQELYLEMVANPDAVHRLFAFLAEDNEALGQWEEDQGLLTLNHDGNQGYCSGSSQFSDETAVAAGGRVLSTDRFGYLESQESAGISPDMFDAFVMPHLSRFAAHFKLLKFGCCEPVHDFMPHLQRLHGLRKVSVTPWCDLRKLTVTCREDVIWSRKPVPLLLCGDEFRLEALREHLRETLDIGRDSFVEFVFRDTTNLTGAMADRVARTCAMIRDLTGHPEGSRTP